MSEALRDVSFEFVDLAKSPKIANELMNGQKEALRRFGASDEVIKPEDSHCPNGTFALVARGPSGEVIGGVRIHSRLGNRVLPIESDESPLPTQSRKHIAGKVDLCELRGLWAAPPTAGRLVSRRLVSRAISLCYELGFKSIVALAHWRSYRFVVAPLGFELDTEIPIIPYPDDRFKSVVVWHNGGAVSEPALSSLSHFPL